VLICDRSEFHLVPVKAFIIAMNEVTLRQIDTIPGLLRPLSHPCLFVAIVRRDRQVGIDKIIFHARDTFKSNITPERSKVTILAPFSSLVRVSVLHDKSKNVINYPATGTVLFNAKRRADFYREATWIAVLSLRSGIGD
jgi:hypothetical protein